MDSSKSIHPVLYQEFLAKCRKLGVKNPNHLIAALMRDFILECDMTNNSPEILVDSTLIEKEVAG